MQPDNHKIITFFANLNWRAELRSCECRLFTPTQNQAQCRHRQPGVAVINYTTARRLGIGMNEKKFSLKLFHKILSGTCCLLFFCQCKQPRVCFFKIEIISWDLSSLKSSSFLYFLLYNYTCISFYRNRKLTLFYFRFQWFFYFVKESKYIVNCKLFGKINVKIKAQGTISKFFQKIVSYASEAAVRRRGLYRSEGISPDLDLD
jgi:hypothetical protein